MPTLIAQLSSTNPWWMTEFRSSTWQHAIVVGVAGTCILIAVLLGRWWMRSTPRYERTMRYIWALGIIPLQLWSIIYWLLPNQFNIQQSLPLHICDLIVWVVPLALLTDRRWAKALVYYMGIVMSILAFITPVLTQGVGSMHFWLFWIGHTQIVGSAIYLCAVMGFKPNRRDLLYTILISLIYAAAILPINILLNVSYGYIGNLDSPAIVTKFGPWPWRIFPMAALMFGVFALLWFPWSWRAKRSGENQLTKPLGVNVPTRDDDANA
jgi:hypothetical integral membrane protein (TIGR02206 family)